MNSSEHKGCFIAGRWRQGGGASFSRHDPAEGRLAWEGHAASDEDVDAAVAAAGGAAEGWAALPVEARGKYLDAFGQAVGRQREEMLAVICRETGRPRWEVRQECDALLAKIDLTKKAFAERRNAAVSVKDGVTTATRYRPLGPLAVLGPFNLPAHLPNGHIVPALLAGNTVVFKPSEMTPGTGEVYARCWEEADLPAGVFNMIHGGREQGARLATHAEVAGVLFTGSRAGGVALSVALAQHPEKMLALEMGGNNPLIAVDVGDIDAAASTIVQSAFITSGQRCTCARRLIVLNDSAACSLLSRVWEIAAKLRVGPPSGEPEPFMGPVISEQAAERLMAAQNDLAGRGASVYLPMRRIGKAMVTPAIIEVTGVNGLADEEHFGPLLQVIRAENFDAAIAAANATRYGLAAALLSRDPALYERFLQRVRAGIVNWNRPTTGASSALPFGGIGASGNHRPAGWFSVDYTNDPVASLESPVLAMPATLSPGITL